MTQQTPKFKEPSFLADVDANGCFATREQFFEAMTSFSLNNELMFLWRGHGYTSIRTNDKTFAISEWNKVETDREFNSVDEMLENYVLATGEKLGEVITQVEIESFS